MKLLYRNDYSHAAIECPPLAGITNGFITYTIDNTPNYDLGTVATYVCDAGFVLDLSLGRSEIRTCIDDNGLDTIGVFDRQAPRCVRKSLLVLFTENFSNSTIINFNNHMQVTFANLFSLTPMV